MKTEYTNDLPYPNDIPQEVDRWVAKCIRCNMEFVNTLTDPISYAIAIRIPSFENSFWIYLPDGIITVDVKHRQPTQAIFSQYYSTPGIEAPKSSYHI
jgi:hypothetical protein